MAGGERICEAGLSWLSSGPEVLASLNPITSCLIKRPLTGNDAVRAVSCCPSPAIERRGRGRWIGRIAHPGPRQPARPGPERPEAAGSRQNAAAMAAGKVAG